MKKLILLALSFIVLGCSSGGGGGNSPTGPSGSAPAISNLNYSPHSVTVGSGGGAATVTGTINFIDADGDVTTLYIGSVSSTLTGMSGLTSGTIQVTAIVDTTTARSETFQVWVKDSQGHESNKLSGTFTVN